MICKRRFLISAKSGSAQLSEFSAALVLLIIGIIFPLLDLGILPVHWILCQEIVSSEARRLAQCQSFSKSIDSLANDSSLTEQLARIGGVKAVSAHCYLAITMLNPPCESVIADSPKDILPAWLPEGAKSPCRYEIEVSSVVELSPLILLKDFNKVPIPGLTEPFICTIKDRAHWEEYGRDPATKKYYLAE